MKKRYLFNLAALALLTAACSSDEMALTPNDQPTTVEQKIPFTAVISADAASTRALTEAEDGKTITAKWEKDEEVALIHGTKVDVLKVAEVNTTTGAATITGDITNPTDGESVFVVYVGHGSENMAKLQESLTGVTGDIAEADISGAMNSFLMTQDGTLKGISDNFDFRLATAKFAVKDSKATFASEVKMPARYAIWKLNLTTDGTTALKVKDLLMQRTGDEEAHAAVDLGTEKTSSEFYLAFIPSAQANTYSFKATTSDDKTYTCTPTVSTTLSAGKFYRSTLTMTLPTPPAPDPIPVTGVTLSETELELTIGDTGTLTATVAPEDADDKTVSWSSSDESVATVDQNGEVTAVGAGEATITVTTTDGSKTADCKVTVTAAPVAVTGVELNKTSMELNVGDSETLTATVAPTDATNKAVTWKSSKESVATVDQNGKVTAVAAGEATITVTTTDGSKTAECKVTVKKMAGSIKFTTTSFEKITSDDAFTNTTLTVEGDGKVTYKSDKESVAKVDATTGEVTITGEGEATITATVEDSDTYTYATNTATYKVIVKATGINPRDPFDEGGDPLE